METYQTPGRSFSAPTVDLDKGLESLRALSGSAFLRSIHSALGKESGLSLVGGIVRDALLTTRSNDLDLASKLPPGEVHSRLEAAGMRVIDTGIDHGTVTILTDEWNKAEITTFRAPSARDETRFSDTIEEDLSGRDFTINAIAFSVQSGELIDPLSGISDLRGGILSAAGDPAIRFQEDPLRLLRMVRFGSAQGRRITGKTLEAATSLVHTLASVSPERIREELLQILLAPLHTAGLQTLLRTGLLEQILPELLPSIGCEQNEFHKHDVFDHTLWVLDRTPPEKHLRLAALFHDIGKPHTLSVDEEGRRHFYRHETKSAEIAEAVMERLRFSKKDIRSVSQLVRFHMRPLQCGPTGVRRIMRDCGEQFETWLKLKRADAPPLVPEEEFESDYRRFMDLVEEERERQRLPEYGQLAVDGNDLMELGFKPGPALGEALGELEEIVLANPARNKKAFLLRRAKKMLPKSQKVQGCSWSVPTAVMAAFIGMFAFNQFYFRTPDPGHQRFLNWLEKIESAPEAPVSVELSANGASWTIKGEQSMRLLSVMESAKVFSEKRKEEQRKAASARYRLSVNGEGREFQAELTDTDLRGDVRLQNLVRLIQIFSADQGTDQNEGKENENEG